MDDRRPRPRGLLFDEATRTLLLFAAASLFGLASVLLFIFTPGDSPTRVHLALLLVSMVIMFYLTIRSSPA
ncbi:hypothetical protein [Halorussus litoreus]|uniref:hypothetical protein n=1 Tax=Halorussus litoreus TaxID=1710536 RepID=UPI000E223F93|nr:hypothetical protein [Halorussus litoreus]